LNVGDIAAKIRNIFMPGEFSKRNDDGTLQVTTAYGRVIDGVEPVYPYGFCAKAEKGTVTILCAGGNLDAVRVLPVEDSEYAPELKDGDTAIYTSGGSFVICRKDGTVEVNGTQNGGVVKASELKNQLSVLTARVDALYNALKNAPTAAQDGGASFKSGIVSFLSAITQKEDFSNIESDKVMHGTGAET
jgi:bacteriophage Mu gp45 protein